MYTKKVVVLLLSVVAVDALVHAARIERIDHRRLITAMALLGLDDPGGLHEHQFNATSADGTQVTRLCVERRSCFGLTEKKDINRLAVLRLREPDITRRIFDGGSLPTVGIRPDSVVSSVWV